MTDLHTRFRTLDNLSAPDLWNDIEESAMAAEPRPTGTNRWVLIAVHAAAGCHGRCGPGRFRHHQAAGHGGRLDPALRQRGHSALPSATAEATAAQSATPSSTPAQVAPAWTATGTMIAGRDDGHPAARWHGAGDGRLRADPDSPLAEAELYDPDSGTWTATGSMVEASFGRTATRLSDGRVLVAGGGGQVGPCHLGRVV